MESSGVAMSRAPACWSSIGYVGETSVMASSARRTQLEPQLQQKNAAGSAGHIRNQEVFNQQPENWEKRIERQFNWMREERGKVIHEGCEEFSRMFREQLQEFARLLSTRYQFNIPAEFFNKSEGSGVNNHNSKGASLEEESVDGKQLDHSSTCTDELAREQATSVGGPFLGPDIGVGIPPQIPNLLKAENQQRLDQVLDASHAAKEALIKQSRLEQPYMCSKETINEDEEVLTLEEVSIGMKSAVVAEKLEEEMGFQDTTTERVHQKNKSILGELIAENKIQSCREEWRTVAAEGKLKKAAEEVKNPAVENKTPAILFVSIPGGQSEFLSMVRRDGMKARIDATAAHYAVTLMQSRVGCPKQVYFNRLRHLHGFARYLCSERGGWVVRTPLTAAKLVCPAPITSPEDDEIVKEVPVSIIHPSGLKSSNIEGVVMGKIGVNNSWLVSAAESKRTLDKMLGLQKLFQLEPPKLWKKRKKQIESCGRAAFLGDKKCFRPGEMS